MQLVYRVRNRLAPKHHLAFSQKARFSAIGALVYDIESASTFGTFGFAETIKWILAFAAVHLWCFFGI